MTFPLAYYTCRARIMSDDRLTDRSFIYLFFLLFLPPCGDTREIRDDSLYPETIAQSEKIRDSLLRILQR